MMGNANLVSVDVVESIQQHLHDLLNLRQCELNVGIAQQAGQIVLAEIKHQVYAALVTVKLGGCTTHTNTILFRKKNV